MLRIKLIIYCFVNNEEIQDVVVVFVVKCLHSILT